MADDALVTRVEILERKMELLENLPTGSVPWSCILSIS